MTIFRIFASIIILKVVKRIYSFIFAFAFLLPFASFSQQNNDCGGYNSGFEDGTTNPGEVDPFTC